MRGFAADYDEWGAPAGGEWDFAHVSKYFAKIEAGPLVISPQRSPRSSTAAWLRAVRECGYDIEDPNCDAPEGFCETIVTQRRGARWSRADAYLKPALGRANLMLYTAATATRVIFDGRRAVGVEFHQLGQRRDVRARREVVLAGGAVNTPQLMLSGIGDREQLGRHGIDVVADAPEVGQNLMGLFAVPVGFDVPDDSLQAAEKPLELVNYLLRRRGMLTSNVGEAYGFVRSRPDLDVPDLELIFAPAPFFDEGIGDVYERHAVVMGPILVKPRSRGSITLRSSDSLDKPVIDPQYLSDDAGADRAALLAGLQMSACIARSAALSGVFGRIARPLGAKRLNAETYERAINECSQTLYHPVGTCRVGSDDASVVDPQLRVRGVDGLRVADASVMPAIVRGHTHAPSALIGEKASDLIRA